MANYTATSNMTLEAAIAAGPMTDGDNLTINNGAIVTCTQTPSILMGQIDINDGELKIDGENISSGNLINFVGELTEEINVNGRGKLTVNGDWYSIGTTDGSNSQVIDLSSATGSDYWDGDFCIDSIPMIQIETGRRITFDNASGVTPEVDDWVYKTSDLSVMGRIVQVESTYLVVRFLTGSLADDDAIEVRKIVDNNGPDYQISWTANVNSGSGDIKESGVYQEFGNTRANGTAYISYFHHGVGGFVFDHDFQSTDLTLGSASGSTGGFVPPSGCDIRAPNVHFCTSDISNYGSGNTYNTSDDETTWYNLVTTSAGDIEFSICNFGNAFFGCTGAYAYSAEYCGATVCMGSAAVKQKALFSHCVVVQDPNGHGDPTQQNAFSVTDDIFGATLTDCMNIAPENNAIVIGGETSFDVEITGCISSKPSAGLWFTVGNYSYWLYRVIGITMDNNIFVCANDIRQENPIMIEQSSDFTLNNTIGSATQDETAGTLTGQEFIYLSNANNGYISGVSMIGGGISGNELIRLYDSFSVKIRAIGMIGEKIDHASSANSLISLGGLCYDVDIARCWKDNGIVEECVTLDTTCRSVLIQNCSGKYDSKIQPDSIDDIRFKGMHGGNGTPGSYTGWEEYHPAMFGYNIHDGFRSNTVGVVGIIMITPSSSCDETTVLAGNPKFMRDGTLDMVSGDILEIEQGYWCKGHTGFSGTYTATIGTSNWNDDEWSNVTVEFQYKLFDGDWNGSWLNARTAGNWTGISGDIEEGFKLKFKLTATGTQTDMTLFLVDTTTTLTDQQNNLYAIDQPVATITLTNVVVGSEYWIYNLDTSEVLDNGTAASSTVQYVAEGVDNGTNILVRVRKSSASPKYIPFDSQAVVTSEEVNMYVSQQPDIVA